MTLPPDTPLPASAAGWVPSWVSADRRGGPPPAWEDPTGADRAAMQAQLAGYLLALPITTAALRLADEAAGLEKTLARLAAARDGADAAVGTALAGVDAALAELHAARAELDAGLSGQEVA